MQENQKASTKILKAVIAAAPFVMMAVCGVLYFTVFRNITPEQLLKYTPENIWLAAIVIVVMFSLKSLSFFFPMFVIMAVCGTIAPSIPAALLINTAGIFCMMNIPYFIGRFAEKEFVQKLLNRNKKLKQIHDIHMDNEVFLIIFLRAINILPYDVVSMFLGSVNTSRKNYILGSFIGTFPSTCLATIMGYYADNPTSPHFIVPAAAEVVLAIGAGLWYIIYMKRKKSHD